MDEPPETAPCRPPRRAATLTARQGYSSAASIKGGTVMAVVSAPPVVGDRRKNTSAWASYNRRRWDVEKDVLGLDDRAPFVCECASPACLSAVELTMME